MEDSSSCMGPLEEEAVEGLSGWHEEGKAGKTKDVAKQPQSSNESNTPGEIDVGTNPSDVCPGSVLEREVVHGDEQQAEEGAEEICRGAGFAFVGGDCTIVGPSISKVEVLLTVRRGGVCNMGCYLVADASSSKVPRLRREEK